MALRTIIITTRRAGAIASVVINRGPSGTGTGSSSTNIDGGTPSSNYGGTDPIDGGTP